MQQAASQSDRIDAVHMSLNVADLAQSVAFYRVLFGVEPAKQHDDYAKFELADPPVVFSLQPGPRPPGASLSHIGLRFTDPADVLRTQERLAAAGFAINRQDGVVCGYAKQSKCWVSDPDQNWWEVYVLEHDVDPQSTRAALSKIAPGADGDAGGEELEFRLDSANRQPPTTVNAASLHLMGWWPKEVSETQRVAELRQLLAALKPGGRLRWSLYAASRPMNLNGVGLEAPGIAGRIHSLATEGEPAELLVSAGFTEVQIVGFAADPASTVDGSEVRPLQVVAVRPVATDETLNGKTVLYKGPFEEIADGLGNRFVRGKRTPVADSLWRRMKSGPTAEYFSFAEPDAEVMCSTGD